MAPVGCATPSALHLIVLCCAPLLRAQLVHVVTPQNAAAATTTTTPDTPDTPPITTTPDTFLTAFQHAQKLRLAPADRNDLHDSPDAYDTLTRSSHLPPEYPPLTHDFISVSPPPAPYAPPTPPHYPSHAPPTSSHYPSNDPPTPPNYPPNAPPTPPHYPPTPPHYPSHAPPTSSHYPPNDPPTPPHYPSHAFAPHSHWPHPHPVAPSCPPTPYSSPSSPLLPFLPAKLSLKLLLKILLKLVLFKMAVKLIAVVCLLLLIPALKSKASAAEGEGAEDRRARHLSVLSEVIWDSLDEKKWMYGDDEDMKDMRDIAEQDEDEQENALSSPTRAVNFLRFCVSAVDRVVGYILGVLQKQRNERREDLASFVLEELPEFFKNL